MLAWETWKKEFLERERDWERKARRAREQSGDVQFWRGVGKAAALFAGMYVVFVVVLSIMPR